MTNIKLRNLVGYLEQYSNIDTLLFTGGNSKNGPEYFFRQHIKDYNIQLKVVSNEVPRIQEFKFCHFWIRNVYRRPNLKKSSDYTFWQYSSKGKVDGINGFVDLNVFVGSKVDLQELLIPNN